MPLPLDSTDSLQRVHQRLDADQWEDIYIIGDVHGCFSELEALVDKLSIGPDDLVVFVGDLVRKGPDSCGVLEFVMERPNMFTVRGNNEQKLIDGDAELPALGPKHFEYIESMPVIISWDDVAVVHGGIDHRKPLAEHSVDELLNMRSLAEEGGYNRPFWFETRCESPRVFFGHTVLSEPLETEATVGLDTGCVHGRQLTAYDYRASRFVTLSPETTYVDRSSDSIVTPQAQSVLTASD
ncbi:metallophosphoesterase family protein [Halorussus sp. AFM4]|uniref:metallophosphoesterase family protein n=1 Tax=Halorussus sp. AFM4 TaxID=3421651 RepID=UPI003EC141DC